MKVLYLKIRFLLRALFFFLLRVPVLGVLKGSPVPPSDGDPLGFLLTERHGLRCGWPKHCLRYPGSWFGLVVCDLEPLALVVNGNLPLISRTYRAVVQGHPTATKTEEGWFQAPGLSAETPVHQGLFEALSQRGCPLNWSGSSSL